MNMGVIYTDMSDSMISLFSMTTVLYTLYWGPFNYHSYAEITVYTNNSITQFYVNVITYPYTTFHDGVASISLR